MYFAFVESNDPTDDVFDWAKGEKPDDAFIETHFARIEGDLGPPTDIVWLDCVRADYFSGLDWRYERCDGNDPGAANRRRQQLLELDATQFEVAWVPINGEDETERQQLALLSEVSWHLVRLGPSGVLPAMTAPDFDLEDGQRQLKYVTHEGFARDEDQRALVNAFSLDFLHDMPMGGETPPSREPPDKGGGPPEKRPPKFDPPIRRVRGKRPILR